MSGEITILKKYTAFNKIGRTYQNVSNLLVYYHWKYMLIHCLEELTKLKKINTAISTIQEKVARALNVTPKEINLDTNTTEDSDLLQIKAENFDRLLQLTKERLSAIKANTEIISQLSYRNLVNQKNSKFL